MFNADEIHIDISLVHRLIARQFPQWSAHPIKAVEFGGCDNRTFHLGEQMIVRLPSDEDYSPQVEKEQFWLPKFAPFLPLPIPIPLAMGKPGEGYPWHWSVYKWLNGKTATVERIDNLCEFATTLAEFLVALQQIDAADGPKAGPHNFYRGGPLTIYDTETRQAIAMLDDKIEAKALTEVWNAAIASSWGNSPVWVHGDVAIGNLLVEKGKLSAVIDFGSMGVGDPACDLAIAWTIFKKESRDAFYATLALDSATWTRGRGWALWKTLCSPLPSTSHHEIERVLAEVLADYNCTK